MGRIKPAWYYERQRAEAERRETYYRNRTPPPDGTTVQSRGPSTDLFYRSLVQRNGTDPIIYKVGVLNSTLARVTAVEAGLKTTLADTEFALRLRGSGVKVTRAHWYQGDATPVRVRTDWNTSYTRYYNNAGDRSHYSIPLSTASGTLTVDEVSDKFKDLFGPGGSKISLLGTANGRAYLELEKAPVAYNT